IYAYKQLPLCVRILYGWAVEVVRHAKKPKVFKVLAKRWIVERTFAWLGRCRRLSKDYERSSRVSETWISLAMIGLMLRRLRPASSTPHQSSRPGGRPDDGGLAEPTWDCDPVHDGGGPGATPTPPPPRRPPPGAPFPPRRAD